MLPDEDELDQMKRIPLMEIASALGYVEIRSRSSRATCFMKHPKSEHKIIISVRSGTGHYTYFSVGGSTTACDAGTVIDLLQHVHGNTFNLGKCRQFMRQFVAGSSRMVSFSGTCSPSRQLLPTEPDIENVRMSFARFARPLTGGRHSYLNDTRCLRPEFLNLPIFSRAIFEDRLGNALFPHRDAHGELTGYSSRGPGRKSFSKGGLKSLWFADCGREERKGLCIGEGVISVLSFAAIHFDDQVCYLSTEGALSPLQVQLIASAIAKLRPMGTLTIAADSDHAGEAFAATILNLWSKAGLNETLARVRKPSLRGASDWNDELVSLNAPSSRPGSRTMRSLPRFHVYLLWSAKTNQVYCGSTGNLRRRLKCHNSKNNKGWTKRGQPWRLLAVRCYLDRHSALRAERTLKRSPRAKQTWLQNLPCRMRHNSFSEST